MEIIKNNKEQTIDLMYIELTDMQRNLEESSKNCNLEGKKINKIICEIKSILNIKQAS